MIVPAPTSRHATTHARPRWPGPSITTESPGRVFGISTAQRNPAPSGLNITASCGDSVGSTRCTMVFGARYMYCAVGAPEPGWLGQRNVRVDASRVAQVIAAGETRTAMATRQHRFDRNAIADVDFPAARRAIADLGDASERLVARYHRHRRAQLAFELLVVGAADAARLDAQDRRIVVDVGDRDVARFERPNRRLHHRERGARQRAHRAPSRMRCATAFCCANSARRRASSSAGIASMFR